MIRKLIFAALFSASTILTLNAQTNGFGLGVMVGAPTGISGKYWLSNSVAVDGGIGWSFVGPNDGFSIHADYLYHINTEARENIHFPLYYGFGVQLRNEAGDFGLGFRGVGGIVWYLNPEPIDIFVELAPVFKLLPKTNLELDFAVGGRYYFN